MSKTTNLQLYKHDNPSTNTDQFDVEKSLNENWDKIDEAYGTNDINIQELQNKVTSLEAQNAQLESQIPTGEALGNPIHLVDSSDLDCEIVVVGNAEQEVREGYNLCNAPYTADNKLTLTATRDDYYKSIGYYATLEAGVQYRVSFESDGSYGATAGTDTVQMLLLKDDKYEKTYTISGKDVLLTPNVSGDYYVRVDVNKDGAIHNFWNFFIRKSTETREFELFGASPSPDYPSKIVTVGQDGSVEIDVVNKNKFNVGERTSTNVGLNITYNKSSIGINGTCTGGANLFREDGNSGIYLGKFKPGKYYITRYPFSGFTKVGSGFAMYIRKDSPSGTSIFNFGTDNTLQQKSITFTEDTDLYITMWANANDIYNNVEFLFSIYEDDSTEYIAHESQTVSLPIQKEFVKIEEAEDTFIKKDGRWYEAHYSPKFVFDGTENLTANGQVNGYYRYDFSLNGMQKGYKKAILSHFKGTDETSFTSITEICMATHPSHPTIVFITDFSTVDEFKTWISEQYANGKPMEGYYVSSTPELIPCTPEQEQILNSFHTYKNITNISVSGIGTVKVIYKKDLETINKNNEARIAALEAALVS